MEVKYKTIKRPVATRWNTHAVMLQSMIALRGPLAMLADDHKGLTKLSAEEWKVLVGLEDVLRVSFPFIFLHIFTYYSMIAFSHSHQAF